MNSNIDEREERGLARNLSTFDVKGRYELDSSLFFSPPHAFPSRIALGQETHGAEKIRGAITSASHLPLRR